MLVIGENIHIISSHVKRAIAERDAEVLQKLAKAPHKESASVEIFTDIVKGLKDICQGVHLVPVGWEDKLPKFLDAAKL